MTAETPPLATAGAVISGPIVHSLSTELPGDQSAVYGGRIWIRMAVTALCWHGDVLRAVEAITRLVDNGVRHGMPDDVPRHRRRLSLRAAVTEAGELLIDISDLNPSFPDFDAAVRGEKGRGLWRVARLGARVIRFLPHEGEGKSVRAVLPPWTGGPLMPKQHYWNGMHVPYITAWTAEAIDQPRIVRIVGRGGEGIGYEDEDPVTDRRHEALWVRSALAQGRGQPQFRRVNSLRQKRAMRYDLCQVCGETVLSSRAEERTLHLLGDATPISEGETTAAPPVHPLCAIEAIENCHRFGVVAPPRSLNTARCGA